MAREAACLLLHFGSGYAGHAAVVRCRPAAPCCMIAENDTSVAGATVEVRKQPSATADVSLAGLHSISTRHYSVVIRFASKLTQGPRLEWPTAATCYFLGAPHRRLLFATVRNMR